MAEEKDAFYVVKKGGVVGIYKSLNDIQPLIASSSDPYASGGRSLGVSSSSKLLQGAFQSDTSKFSGSSLHSTNSQRQVPFGGSSLGLTNSQRQFTPGGSPLVSTNSQRQSTPGVSPLVSTNSQGQFTLGGSQAQFSNSLSCTLEFDGASKGNPGPAGAGAILRAGDGSKVYRIREGIGSQTNNVAEYRALLLGLKQALEKGYQHIRVQGDSQLVCKQVNGEWKQKNQNMAMLCAEVNQLKKKFLSFQINHIPRERNSEADAEANLAINLRVGQVEEDCVAPKRY
ncbi:hypothetical protein PIB30_116864 [Stylosanthes scabra]|uniref:RNase H type-1 domain-containing protein n=1 Tax=Stylosanthes scabra TaxID=79078 RepID=A0ABU6QB49_9FABA|nr:hypothetical protein [Stylosanthes scabra]